VYVPDDGATEPRGRTRRAGIDLEIRARMLPWLWADTDVNFSRGRFRDEARGANLIPLAPSVTAGGGLSVRDVGAASGGVRFRYIGARPADESASVMALGSALWELFAGWKVSAFQVVLAIDNVLGSAWNDAQFATTSRLPGERAEGFHELHFTPGTPRSLQLGIEYRF
jgi:outer membrane receptor protein involved in Fe transport